MESTVRTRPNHYELLGLKPSASSAEIADAFRREMSALRPRAFGGLAEVSIAYETLRDPARRLAYDESIGVRAKPEPQPRPQPPRAEFKPFMVRASARPAESPPQRFEAAPSGPDPKTTELNSEAAPMPQEQRIDPALESIAARLRELAKPTMLPEHPNPPAVRPPESRPEPDPALAVDPLIEEILATGRAEKAALHEREQGSIDWKRAGMAAGGLIAGAALLGAWAGLDAGDSVEAQQPEKAETVKIPAPRVVPESDRAPVAAASEAPATRVLPRHRRDREGIRKPLQINLPPDEEPALGEPVDPSQLPEIAIDRPAQPEQAATPATSAAKLPLSNATIARTIGRIGYPCGKVASTTQSDAPGVFTVTCTSGHSYRAAPVRGRYHFRRAAGG